MILLTGGAGYIGSHCAVELLKRGYQVVILDNLVNSYNPKLEEWIKLAGLPELPIGKYDGRLQFIWHDLNNSKLTPQLEAVLRCVHTVIHLAALKSVPESVADPLRYYRNNLDALLTVLEWVKLFKIPYIVFSSSATVYGDVSAPSAPNGAAESESGASQVSETSPCAPTNPYGFTKLWGEQIIRDFCQTGTTRGVALRYMNPYGSLSEELAEHPRGLNGPSNLYPVVLEVAQGKRSHVTVYGSDYPTRDGTGERDYVHVQDVAEAHARVIECWGNDGVGDNTLAEERFHEINIGTGRATSVLEVIAAVERDYQVEIPYKVESRRPGDVASLVVNVEKAWRLLNWKGARPL
jgi:UDP-glucose 4-epimerase